jgi:hypothetical protein
LFGCCRRVSLRGRREGFEEALMIVDVRFDERASEVRVGGTSDALRVVVDALDVRVEVVGTIGSTRRRRRRAPTQDKR